MTPSETRLIPLDENRVEQLRDWTNNEAGASGHTKLLAAFSDKDSEERS